MSLFRKDVRDACAAVIKNNLHAAVGCSKRRFDHDDLGQPKHNWQCDNSFLLIFFTPQTEKSKPGCKSNGCAQIGKHMHANWNAAQLIPIESNSCQTSHLSSSPFSKLLEVSTAPQRLCSTAPHRPEGQQVDALVAGEVHACLISAAPFFFIQHGETTQCFRCTQWQKAITEGHRLESQK